MLHTRYYIQPVFYIPLADVLVPSIHRGNLVPMINITNIIWEQHKVELTITCYNKPVIGLVKFTIVDWDI